MLDYALVSADAFNRLRTHAIAAALRSVAQLSSHLEDLRVEARPETYKSGHYWAKVGDARVLGGEACGIRHAADAVPARRPTVDERVDRVVGADRDVVPAVVLLDAGRDLRDGLLALGAVRGVDRALLRFIAHGQCRGAPSDGIAIATPALSLGSRPSHSVALFWVGSSAASQPLIPADITVALR